MSANIEREDEIKETKLGPHITEEMIYVGIAEYRANRSFDHDWQVVARIYTAMNALDPQAQK